MAGKLLNGTRGVYNVVFSPSLYVATHNLDNLPGSFNYNLTQELHFPVHEACKSQSPEEEVLKMT